MDITNFIRNGVTYPVGDAKSRESIATAFDSTASYSAHLFTAGNWSNDWIFRVYYQ